MDKIAVRPSNEVLEAYPVSDQKWKEFMEWMRRKLKELNSD